MHFLVERFWPNSNQQMALVATERLQAGCAQLRAAGVEVRWLGATYVPTDEALSSRFAGTMQAIRAVHEITGERFDRILPMIEFDAPDGASTAQKREHREDAAVRGRVQPPNSL